MKKLIILISLLILSLLITGCPQMRQLDTLGIITARGIDINDEDLIKSNFVMLQFEEQSEEITNIVSGVGNTSMGAIENADNESNFLLEPGDLQLDLYGLKAAKKGIAPHLDILNRNTHTPDLVYLALSKTTAEEVINVQEQDFTTNIGQYLHKNIDKTGESPKHFPKMDLQRFMLYYKDVGRDPILPIFEILDGKPKINSIGVLQSDKYVGQLPIDNTILFNLHFTNVQEDWLQVSIPSEPFQRDLHEKSPQSSDNINMTIEILKNKSQIKLNRGSLEFNHSISLQGNLTDTSSYGQLDLQDQKVLKKIEKEVKKELKRRYEKLLEELQDFNSDPFGYGEVYRQHLRHEKLTTDKWRKLYPDIKVNYDLDVNLIYHGETY